MKKTPFLHLIGILIFIIILMKLDLSKTFKILANTNIPFFILSLIIFFPMLIIKCFRWNYIKKTQHMNYPLKDSILMYFSGFYIGILTPGRLGEFVKVLYLTKDKHPFGKSFLTVFLDRLLDLMFLFLSSYLSLLIFINILKKEFYILSTFIIASLFIFIILILNKNLTKKVFMLLFNLFIPKNYKKKLKLSFYDFYNGLKLFNKKHLFVIFLLTAFSWILYFVQVYFLALAININIPFLYLLASITVAATFTLIPISISGIGTRDITLIFFFSLLGISKELAVSLSILILLMTIFAILPGLVAWFVKPIKLN